LWRANQTFATLPFSMAPEDVDTELETDDTVRDICTLLSTMHDLPRQVRETKKTLRVQTEMLREKEQTLQEQTEMLREKDETLREQDQTIQMLLAREGRFKG
jgi:hypothetical protein